MPKISVRFITYYTAFEPTAKQITFSFQQMVDGLPQPVVEAEVH